jgi:hypothetical protein
VEHHARPYAWTEQWGRMSGPGSASAFPRTDLGLDIDIWYVKYGGSMCGECEALCRGDGCRDIVIAAGKGE